MYLSALKMPSHIFVGRGRLNLSASPYGTPRNDQKGLPDSVLAQEDSKKITKSTTTTTTTAAAAAADEVELAAVVA